MPRVPKSTSRLHDAARQAREAKKLLSDDSDCENVPPDNPSPPANPPSRKKKTLSAQLAESNERITELEGTVTNLEAALGRLQNEFDELQRQYTALASKNEVTTIAHNALKNLKRKADVTFTEELRKKNKRIKRLEKERTTQTETSCTELTKLDDTLDAHTQKIAELGRDLASALNELVLRDKTIKILQDTVKTKQSTLTVTRKHLYTSQKKNHRLTVALGQIRSKYKDLLTWNPTLHGQFTTAARELARRLTQAGCAAEKIAYAVESCASAFGIRISRSFMSARTVARAIDEGGKYGEIQLAREIMDAPGFVASSDGTSLRGLTIESRHITLLTPSYEPGVDDADQSTWTHRTRFLEVAPALDHTAQRQFEGESEAAARVATVYSNSPLAAKERRIMDKNDYWRKKMGEMKDHAADGKKGFKISADYKKEVIVRDMGREALDDEDLTTGQILLSVLDVKDADLLAVGRISTQQLAELSTEARSQLAEAALELKIGQEKFDLLSPEEQQNKCTHIFGGCCCHKDLNVVKYGYLSIQRAYDEYGLPPPLLLPNKAHASTIRVGAGDNDSEAAVRNAIESSTSGAIKLLQLIGSLLQHRDKERGYQDKCGIFMREHKMELFDLDEPSRFPDVSNNRYGAYTYAAAEVVCFHTLIHQLIHETLDGKTNSGKANHVEQNVLNGLACPVTMAEMVALALYGASVSWPYMAQVRTTKESPVNLLSLTDLHRKLPIFCSNIAAHPYLLLDPTASPDQLTIDGRPFGNKLLFWSIDQLRPLPNLFLVISRMFSGCETGWIRFTPEFHIGGTFDTLTPWQRALLHIPSTNDRNEGALGSNTSFSRDKPNSSPQSFSNRTRAERNNTEAFIKKHCDAAVEKFVMREVRKDGKLRLRTKFRKAFLAFQRDKAEKGQKRREKAAAKKKATEFRLATTHLELNVDAIQAMTSVKLKGQLEVYRDVLKDEILKKKLWKDMATVAVRRTLVLEARARELARRRENTLVVPANPSEPSEDSMVIDEHGYCEGDDAEWEDMN